MCVTKAQYDNLSVLLDQLNWSFNLTGKDAKRLGNGGEVPEECMEKIGEASAALRKAMTIMHHLYHMLVCRS